MARLCFHSINLETGRINGELSKIGFILKVGHIIYKVSKKISLENFFSEIGKFEIDCTVVV